MTVDLSKLVMHSNYPAFKNNTEYTGFFTISGTTAGGVNQVTTTVPITTAPDLCDVLFNGASDTHWEGTYGDIDPRPDGGWFKRGSIWVRGDNGGAGYVDYPTPWVITSKIQGTNLIITATYVQQFAAALTLTSTLGLYKLVDYSVF